MLYVIVAVTESKQEYILGATADIQTANLLRDEAAMRLENDACVVIYSMQEDKLYIKESIIKNSANGIKPEVV